MEHILLSLLENRGMWEVCDYSSRVVGRGGSGGYVQFSYELYVLQRVVLSWCTAQDAWVCAAFWLFVVQDWRVLDVVSLPCFRNVSLPLLKSCSTRLQLIGCSFVSCRAKT